MAKLGWGVSKAFTSAVWDRAAAAFRAAFASLRLASALP